MGMSGKDILYQFNTPPKYPHGRVNVINDHSCSGKKAEQASEEGGAHSVLEGHQGASQHHQHHHHQHHHHCQHHHHHNFQCPHLHHHYDS